MGLKHLIIGTAGHIDHGKTSLIKMLTNFDCDTHKEEKQRGITINLGFTYMMLSNGESVGVIDVPGHKDFINTMIGGACGIDMVMLVIAADSGVMPQTIEHMNIISALGIKKGVIALTKSDLVDDELLEIAEYEIMEFLSGTSLKDAPVIRTSAVTEKGKDELIRAICDIISKLETRQAGSLFRLYIDRIFTVKGFGCVVTGSVMSGSLTAGQDVYLLPGNRQKLRVRSIERHGQPAEYVVAGDRAAINLIGLKKEDFERGMIICNKPLEAGNMIDACIHLFDTGVSLSVWSNIIFISGTFECQARMHLLSKDKLKGNEDAIVQIHLNKPAVLMSKDKFIIRNSSEDKTLGGGYIIEASPLHHRKRTVNLINELTSLTASILSESSLREMIRMALKKEFRPFTHGEIAEKLNLKANDIIAEIEKQETGFIVYKSNQACILVSEQYDLTNRNKVIKALTEHHQRNPIVAGGLEPGELLGKLMPARASNGKTYLDFLLRRMQTEGQVESFGTTWIIKGHKPDFDQQSLTEIEWLEQEILHCGENKPVFPEIEEKAASRNIQKHKIKSYLSYLAGKGKVRFFESDVIHTDILNKNRSILLAHLDKKNNGIDIQEFKDLLGGTKRFRALMIEILEAEKSIKLEAGTGIETKLYITFKGRELIHDKSKSLPG